jgi:hypothetical protein
VNEDVSAGDRSRTEERVKLCLTPMVKGAGRIGLGLGTRKNRITTNKTVDRQE